MRLPTHLQCPKCPECGGPSVPSERAMRGEERPEGRLGCLACGVTWIGTPAQLAKAWDAERAWDRKQDREEAGAKWREKVARDQAKLERLKRGAW